MWMCGRAIAGKASRLRKTAGGDCATGCAGVVREIGGGPELCAAGIQWHGRAADYRRAASGDRGVAEAEGRAICAE